MKTQSEIKAELRAKRRLGSMGPYALLAHQSDPETFKDNLFEEAKLLSRSSIHEPRNDRDRRFIGWWTIAALTLVMIGLTTTVWLSTKHAQPAVAVPNESAGVIDPGSSEPGLQIQAQLPNQPVAVTVTLPMEVAASLPDTTTDTVPVALPMPPLPDADNFVIEVQDYPILEAMVTLLFSEEDMEQGTRNELRVTYPVEFLGNLVQATDSAVGLRLVPDGPYVELSVPADSITIQPDIDPMFDASPETDPAGFPAQKSEVLSDGTVTDSQPWRDVVTVYQAEGHYYVARPTQELLGLAAMSSSECVLKAKSALRDKIASAVRDWYVKQGFGPEIVVTTPVQDLDTSQKFVVSDDVKSSFMQAYSNWFNIQIESVTCTG